jgi:hypothetical protein
MRQGGATFLLKSAHDLQRLTLLGYVQQRARG